MRQHALYRFYDGDDDLLYVGITIDPTSRWKQHRRDKHWWHSVAYITLSPCESRETALLAEAEAITAERPRYNVIHSVASPEPIRDRTVTCDYCHRLMIRYWDDEIPPGQKNQCISCNALMCATYDELRSSGGAHG